MKKLDGLINWHKNALKKIENPKEKCQLDLFVHRHACVVWKSRKRNDNVWIFLCRSPPLKSIVRKHSAPIFPYNWLRRKTRNKITKLLLFSLQFFPILSACLRNFYMIRRYIPLVQTLHSVSESPKMFDNIRCYCSKY